MALKVASAPTQMLLNTLNLFRMKKKNSSSLTVIKWNYKNSFQELLQETRYYCMSDLSELCQSALRQKESEKDFKWKVQLITSPQEEQRIIMSTSKPVVKLLLNRHNNKFSYTRLVHNHLHLVEFNFIL